MICGHHCPRMISRTPPSPESQFFSGARAGLRGADSGAEAQTADASRRAITVGADLPSDVPFTVNVLPKTLETQQFFGRKRGNQTISMAIFSSRLLHELLDGRVNGWFIGD